MGKRRRPARNALTAASSGVCLVVGALWAQPAAAWPEDTIVEVHYNPVANLQIAVWLTDGDDNYLRDLFVTQAVGKLGIGNRSGLWDFLSSWRAPYGPRPSALPVWAHARGKTYPKIVFADPNASHATSLGFHEGTSSAEPYHCRPLQPSEQEGILDSMTCPSPATFRTDKGKFDTGGLTSVYPPRGDIPGFDPNKDHVDSQMYAALNDLDAVTGATPAAGQDQLLSFRLEESEANESTLKVWIEASLEDDQNVDWSFSRELDHFVDPLLSTYGIGYLGQPSVVYAVSFDPADVGTFSTSDYSGYGSWDGSDGVLNPPDASISGTAGSGADRLQLMERFEQTFRAAVHTGEGGTCLQQELPAVSQVVVDAMDFDRVMIHVTMPTDYAAGSSPRRLRVFQELEATAETFDPDRAIEAVGVPQLCDEPVGVELDTNCMHATAGETLSFEVASLFGNYDYAFAVTYDDQCTNSAPAVLAETRTPTQDFQTIETFCFVATAAYGAHWGKEVFALRRFRDHYLKSSELGHALVRSYYAYGPTLARTIKHSPGARAVTRVMLQPVADFADLVSPVTH